MSTSPDGRRPRAGDIVVLKFGGTSVGSPARVRVAAKRAAAHVRRGRRVLVVVSAAGGSTDGILRRARAVVQGQALLRADGDAAIRRHGDVADTAIRGHGDTACRASSESRATFDPAREAGARELDRALATGEDRSAALLALALSALGVPARSLRGGEAGIRAAGDFGGGRIEQVRPSALLALLDAGIVPVVSGFQGQRLDGETLTLGRGASDATAVALAAALGAECHIVTDVAAVYDRDPNRDASARPYHVLGHAQLTALTAAGARVVQEEAARLAERAGVPLHIYGWKAPLSGRGGTRVLAGGAAGNADDAGELPVEAA